MKPTRRAMTIAGALVVILVFAFAADRWASSAPDGFERVATDHALVVEADAEEPAGTRSTISTLARTSAGVVAVALTVLALPRIAARRRPGP